MNPSPSLLASIKQTPLWKLTRGLKRYALPPRHDAALPAGECVAEVEVVAPPVALEAGQAWTWTVRVANRGGVAWSPDGTDPVRLSARWRTFTGEPFGEAASFPLPKPLYPGEPQTLTATFPAPKFVGDFQVEFDLTQSDGNRFAIRNARSKVGTAAVPVQGPRATDIDYHAVFRNADLNANHWWVVGAYHSKEQYEKSSRERLGMLETHAGLTPNSRVLDIGCGTGQMGDALEGYLSDRGAYYGTDIGREAIEFCARRFRKPNFVFRSGEMTRVPFGAEAGAFDIAIFFSVFTHTFTDETALLLHEACRLLGPTGVVVADVITSPLVERGAGHRGEMVVNRDHFLRLAAILGLEPTVIGRWPWNPHAERIMYALRKRSS